MKKYLTIFLLLFSLTSIHAQTMTDIYTVRQDSTLLGRSVAVVGVVTASTGIFDVRRTFIQDQDGGPWSGIAVWDTNGDLYAEIGDLIRVIGTVAETNGLMEIQATSFYIFSSNNSLPEVVSLNTSDIAAGSATTEPYESILVQVTNVVVENDDLGDGEWSVNDGSGACRIDDDADNLLYGVPGIGTEIDSITGILNYSLDNFKIEPRFRSDIADGGSSSFYTISQIQQNATLLGDTVTVTGFVTAATGIYHPAKTYIEEPEGGAFSGILLYDSTEALILDEGDEIQVTCVVKETEGMTELHVLNHEVFSTGNSLPEPVNVGTGDISSDSENAELYESVLVQINNIYISESNLNDGEWEVNDVEGACDGLTETCLIDDEAGDLLFDVPDIGAPLNSITGILVFQNDNFKLEPRYGSDIIEVPYIQIGDTLTIIQRPLLNIPTICQPGDTLEIICDLSQSPSSWSASLLNDDKEIALPALSEEFDDENDLWTLKAILPDTILSELYNLKLETAGENTDISNNSVQIIPQFKDDFYFIHITDTHLPTNYYCYDDYYQQDSSEVEDIRAVIADINLINPAFVLHTGDLIHEGELEDYLYNRYYTKTKRILSEFDVPLYLVPGNHDIGGWDETPMSDGTARRDWWRFFGWKHLNNPSGINPQYTQDYFFTYGNCHLIGLEAYINYDSWRPGIYGGESFITSQLNWLQQHLNTVEESLLKILFYHYDFSEDLNLAELGIDLALWGHTHGDSYTQGEYPISLSTQACSNGNRAFRLIRVKGDSILPSPTLHSGFNGENLTVEYQPANNGLNYQVTAEVTNDLEERFEHTQLRFIMPKDGRFPKITGGTLIQIDDSGSNSVFYIGVDVSENSTQTVTISVYSPSAGPYAENCIIDKRYIAPGEDSLNVRAKIINPEDLILWVNSIFESTDLTIADTMSLYDDGTHGDSTSEDGVYSGYWPATLLEKEYNVHINTVTRDSIYSNLLSDAAFFTTIGPVKYDSLYIARQDGDRFLMRLVLRNEGTISSATNIKAQLAISDPDVENQSNYLSFEDIGPGQAVQSSSFYSFISQNPPDSIHGRIDVLSDDKFFWSDSFSIGFVPSGISESNNEIPLQFSLKQNYPNPFNPVTIINYQLPMSNDVNLSIYNILGQKVATLVNENQRAGYHHVVWDASDFASGVYYYKLQTSGGFVQSLKLFLLR